MIYALKKRKIYPKGTYHKVHNFDTQSRGESPVKIPGRYNCTQSPFTSYGNICFYLLLFFSRKRENQVCASEKNFWHGC